MLDSLDEHLGDNLIYQECLCTRVEGIADISFIVKDLQSETKDLEEKGADILFLTNECALIDARKQGNTIIKLFRNA